VTGSRHYFTGKPCSRGHLAPRFTSQQICKECARENEAIKRHGSLETAAAFAEAERAAVAVRAITPCSVPGCSRVVHRGELCNMHRLRKARRGDVGGAGQEVGLKGETVLRCGKPTCPAAKKIVAHLDYLRNTDAYKRRAKRREVEQVDLLREQRYLYYLRNKDHLKAKVRKWRNENDEQYRSQMAQRREAVRRATPWWVDWSAIDRIYQNRPDGHHVDHDIPLQHPLVCGLHVPANLVYRTAEDNLRKSNRFTG
jgi:hypothetical protein